MSKEKRFWIFFFCIILIFHLHLFVNLIKYPNLLTLNNIKDIVIIISLLWGVFFSYYSFFRERLNFPKLKNQLTINEQILNNKNRLVHVQLSIENIGSVIYRSNYIEIRIRQILPLLEEAKNIISNESKIGFDKKQYIPWPQIKIREWKEKNRIEIEPGESDTLCADFIIPIEVQVIQIYCFIQNPRKIQFGWQLIKIYNIKKRGD